ncbi:MAG: hypothetical protein CL398_00030 [Acidiferrobacteraceae bacterium]|nr:hypothetical protein [Acidiferrobacteraceae bacterium]
MSQRYSGQNPQVSQLEMTEVDGSPDVKNVNKIVVSNGTLTDDGGGQVTLTTGGGGGGGSPGGSNTQVQYNDSGSFGGNAGMTFVAGTGTFTATVLTDGTAQLTSGALTGLTTPLTVGQGGTGASSLTDGGILLGSGSGAVTATSQPTNGQLLIGSTGSDPTLATLTDGGGVTATEGAGTITLGTDGILEDLDTLGAPTTDGEFIVATGAGAFAYETGSTARGSLGIASGNDTASIPSNTITSPSAVITPGIPLTGSEIIMITMDLSDGGTNGGGLSLSAPQWDTSLSTSPENELASGGGAAFAPASGPLNDLLGSGARITMDGCSIADIDTAANTFTVTGALVQNVTGGALNVRFNWIIIS